MYMNERRDDIKAQNPNITFAELTRTVACEWSTMESKKKKVCWLCYFICSSHSYDNMDCSLYLFYCCDIQGL